MELLFQQSDKFSVHQSTGLHGLICDVASGLPVSQAVDCLLEMDATKGVQIGGLVGGAAGAVYGAAKGFRRSQGKNRFKHAMHGAAKGVARGGAVGALAGGVVGHSAEGHAHAEWKRGRKEGYRHGRDDAGR